MICRPLLLHNEFMPAITGERDWDYRVLGYHDGMTVKESFLLEDINSFSEMFHICVSYEDTFIHPYFTQFLFGFHPDKEKDRLFWDNTQQWNFTFVSLLQFSNPDIGQIRKSLESSSFINTEQNIQAIAYYSLDNSDLILVLKCNSYQSGAKIINNLHCNQSQRHNFQLRNSYTVLALNSNDINHSGKLRQLDETIDLLELRIVERYSNSGSALHQKLLDSLERSYHKKINRYALLGTENEAIILQDIAWKDLVPLYCANDPDGILCNSNMASQRHTNAISTKIMLHLDSPAASSGFAEKNGAPHPKTSTSKKKKLLCEIIFEKIQAIYKNRPGDRNKAELKNLLMFTDALQRFENAYHEGKAFSDYNFYLILKPLYIFVELAETNMDVFSNYYYDFMSGMKLCTQNFTKPDRVYSLITDFNMRYFDVPSKLVTLYSAYIYYLKNTLNSDPAFQYEFLVCPGVNNKTQVKELFPRESPTKRLFFVEIPERPVYDPKEMFILLGHETAHFVGRNLRLRESRLSVIIEACSHAIAKSLKHYVLYKENWLNKDIDQENWSILEHKLTEWTQYCVSLSCDKEYLKNKYHPNTTDSYMIERNLKYNEQYFYHTDLLKENLISTMEDLLLTSGTDMLNFAIQTGIRQEHPAPECWNQCYERHCRIIQEAVWGFTASRKRYTALALENVVNDIIYLLKECYADLICVLTLKLPLKDYLNSFVTPFDTDNYNKKYITKTILLPRITIVMTVMSYRFSAYGQGSTSQDGFYWTDDELSGLTEPDIIHIAKESQSFLKNVMADPDYYTDPDNPETLLANHVNIVYDLSIINTIRRYLLCCRKKFNSIICKQSKKNKLEMVRCIYGMAQADKIDNFFPELMQILDQYEKDIYQSIDKLIYTNENINTKRK